MLSHKKRRHAAAKSDPVKDILSRREARQNKTGLSLYTKGNVLDEVLAPAVEQVRGTDSYTLPQKSTIPRFADLSAARQKAHERLIAGSNAGGGQQKYSQRRRGKGPFGALEQYSEDRIVNLTFPPSTTRSSHTVSYNQNPCHDGFAGSSNSDLRSCRGGTDLNVNPFGYIRRTQAFEPIQMNYIVEWPKTWPLKIMSFQQRNRTKQRRGIITNSTNLAKFKVSQSSEEDERRSPEKWAHEGRGVEDPRRHPLSKPSLPRLSGGFVKGDLHGSSERTRESKWDSNAEVPKDKDNAETVRVAVSREVDYPAPSSSVAESTYIALQNDNLQDSQVNPDPAERPLHPQLSSAPPSTPYLSNGVEKQDKGEEKN